MATTKEFGKLPQSADASIIKPFRAHATEESLETLKTLIEHSPIGPAVFENSSDAATSTHRYGITRPWLSAARDHWLHNFDWRKTEDRINSFPNFTASVKGSGLSSPIDIHFLALFSTNPNAIPIVFYHGWPGSILEFLDILTIISTQYTPSALPYHVIVPSLPGYAYSGGPPLDQDFSTRQAAALLDTFLTKALGFDKNGYLVQGGDVGSFIARFQGLDAEACKAVHLNVIWGTPHDWLEMNANVVAALKRGDEFLRTGFAYAMEQGTRPGTIGLALSASPIALLSWVGEKLLSWPEKPLSLDEILASVTLYWLTDTFPRSIYSYRHAPTNGEPAYTEYLSKPLGYSWFPFDLGPGPKSWAAKTGNLVWFRQHESGGHFPALEKPKELWADVEDWVEVVLPLVSAGVKQA